MSATIGRPLAAGWFRFANAAPARSAPELSQVLQDRPPPFGGAPDHSRAFQVAGVPDCENTQQPVNPKEKIPMPDNMRIVRLTQVRLTRAQAHRLIETYGCGDVPREDALERVTEATVTAYDAPRGDRVELDTNVSGEPVSWLAQDEIDRLIFEHREPPPRRGGCPRSRRRPKATSSPRPTATIRGCPGAAGGAWPASRPLDFAAECPRRVTWRADDPHR